MLFDIFDEERKTITFVFPFFEETFFFDLVETASEAEVQAYMFCLMSALEWTHDHTNIMALVMAILKIVSFVVKKGKGNCLTLVLLPI